MTNSGSIAPRRRFWRSLPAAWRLKGSAWCSPRGHRAMSWRDCRSSWWRGWAKTTRAGCSTRCSPGRWMRGSGTRSSPRRAVTRWRCWSCRGGWRPLSWRVGSGSPALSRCRGGSRRASGGGSTVFRPRRGVYCSWRPQTRSASRCWCGEQRSGWGSGLRLRHRQPRSGCSSSARGCGFVIRWCARRPTGRRRLRRDRRCTARWRRSPIRRSIPTAAPGTAPRPRRGATSRSQRSSSARPAEPRRAEAWRRRLHSSSARRC